MALAVLVVLALIPVFTLSILIAERSRETTASLKDRRIPAVLALDQAAAAVTEADRATATSLVSGAFSLTGPGQDYQDAVKRADRFLTMAADLHQGDPVARARLTNVSALMVEYTVMVGLAQTGGDDPLSLANVFYASDLRRTIVTSLYEQRRQDFADIHEARSTWWVGAYVAIPFGAAAFVVLLLLLFAHSYVRRRFRRRANPLLLLAAAALAGLIAVTVVHAQTTHDRLAEAAGRGVSEQSSLWQARTAVHEIVGTAALDVASGGVPRGNAVAAGLALPDLADPLPAPAEIESIRNGGDPSFGGLLATALADDRSRPLRDAGARVLTSLETLRRAGDQARVQAPRGGTLNGGEGVAMLTGKGANQMSGAADDTDAALADALLASRRASDDALTEAADDGGLGLGGPVVCSAVLVLALAGLLIRRIEYGRLR
ncbi:hypothetical protein [Streptomyces sp. SID3343]|uniref:hypothetical protein n=1 Tax=Streptomyces sp. SID3343 TaxID=2690260 RepID=UPI00136F3B1F|nr:hypothetical protein [Streptomyces sp. SID3343]MYV97657.1 hypothetical protein [Streptomyces sp. SID3343]